MRLAYCGSCSLLIHLMCERSLTALIKLPVGSFLYNCCSVSILN